LGRIFNESKQRPLYFVREHLRGTTAATRVGSDNLPASEPVPALHG
jgi:hypothetical protein